MKCTAKVFLLTSEWSDKEGQLEIKYYGRSPKLGPVEIIFDKVKSCFFIPSSADIPELNCKYDRKKIGLKSFADEELDALYFSSHLDARSSSDRLRMTGVPVFESDIKPDERFLMENFINGQMAVNGEVEKKDRLITFINPQIAPCEVNTHFRVASVDIECGVASNRLYSIACHVSGAGEEKKICFMLGDSRESRPGNLEMFRSEQAVLNAFIDWFLEEDPDIIIGWHVIGFDLTYLQNKCESFYMDLNISRNGSKPYLNSPQAGGHYATISGRVVIDGPPAMRDLGYKFENFALETVAQELLGEGKIITSSKENKIAEIEDFFENDKDMLGEYNIQDCVLVTRIFNDVNVIEIMTCRTKTSGLALPGIGISNAACDFLLLPRLHRKGYCAPLPSEGVRQTAADEPLTVNPGVYENVCRLSFAQLLPALISAFKIDPLAKVRASNEDSYSTPGLTQFSKESHVLPDWLDSMCEITSGENAFSKASSITMKQILSAVTSPSCRFYSYDLNSAVTESIMWILKSLKEYLQSEGYILCCASSHNVYVQMKPQEATTALEQGDLLASRTARAVETKAEKDFGVNLSLDLKCREHFTSMVIPKEVSFGREQVSDIRYAASGRDGQLILNGLKIGGADWTAVTAIFQEAFYEALFGDDNIDEWMKGFIADLKEGKYDEMLVYTKKLTKNVDEYAGSLPPHVKAAKLLENPGKKIQYLITSRGPVPKELNPSDIDYQHYIEKQLAPVADVYLELKGQKFENLFKAQQLSLFDF